MFAFLSRNTDQLDNLAQSLGYVNAAAFTRIELKNVASQQLAYFRGRVDLYEQKYDMSFDDFEQRVANRDDIDLKRFGIFEKEDDFMEWESSLHSLHFYQKQVTALTDGGTA